MNSELIFGYLNCVGGGIFGSNVTGTLMMREGLLSLERFADSEIVSSFWLGPAGICGLILKVLLLIRTFPNYYNSY